MNPDHFLNHRQFLVASNPDGFIPNPMTLSELEDEFAPPPWTDCVITNDGDR